MEISLILDALGYVLMAVAGYYSFKAFKRVKNVERGYQGDTGAPGAKGDKGDPGEPCNCCSGCSCQDSPINDTGPETDYFKGITSEIEGIKGTQGLKGDDPGPKGDPGEPCVCGPKGDPGPSKVLLSDLRIGNYVHYNGFRWIVSGVHSPAPSEYPYYDGEEIVDLFDGAGFATIRVKDIWSIPINPVPITVFHAAGMACTTIRDLHKLQNLYFHLNLEELDVDSFDFGDPIN